MSAAAAPPSWLARRFELGRATDGGNLRSMEGLRGFAVFLVFVVHFGTLVEPWARGHAPWAAVFDTVHAVGNAGVDLFFVLSGYLIYGTLIEGPRPFGPYLRRRVQRIYPAFLAVFALYVVLSLALQPGVKIPRDPADAALYLLANLLLLPGLLPIEPLVSVAWSLSYEMFYYLVVPAVIALCGLHARTREWRLGFFVLVTAGLAAGFAVLGGPVRLLMFLAGVLLHEVLRRGVSRVPGAGSTALVVAAALASMTLSMPGPLLQVVRTLVLFGAFFWLCLACFARPDGALARGFSWTPLRWLGNMSYSYYLLHGLSLQVFLTVVQRVLPPASAGDFTAVALLVPAFAFTLLPCAALFLAIERPFSLAVRARPPRVLPLAATGPGRPT